jgi:hypothetical protein
VEDYFFYVGSSKQALDYEITAEFVVNHIKKTFDRGNDVAEALRMLIKADTDIWKPTLKISISTTTTEIKDQEDKQFVMECYCCGKLGHKSPNCRSKDKTPKDEWAINKAQQHIQSSNDDARSTSGSTISSQKEEPVVGWAGLHCLFAQAVDMKELILLDSESTDTVFCNPKCVTNIRDSDDPLSISTNGGVMKLHQKCDIPFIKDVWYNENFMTNIISMKDMTEKF